MTSDKGMRLLLKPLSKIKSTAQDLYTAEDDFWKIYSWAIEKNRIEKAFEAQGIIKNTNASIKRNGVQIKYDDDFLKREAADIVRNNIPNYDYVSDFVKGIRKLPIGNFVSFPAEIARTGTNIVRRALKEINETIEITDGAGKVIKRIKPLEGIGYKRLFGEWNGSAFEFNRSRSTTVDFAKTVAPMLTIESDWLTEDVQHWLTQNLYTSLYVATEDNGELVEAKIKADSYKWMYSDNDMLFNERIKLIEPEYKTMVL
jgi:hypothetical protein